MTQISLYIYLHIPVIVYMYVIDFGRLDRHLFTLCMLYEMY